MNNYMVFYVTPDVNPLDPPLVFPCQADDTNHAEEQCENAYPGCTIVWATMGMTLEESLADYWDTAVEGEIKQPRCPYCQSIDLVATANATWDVNKQEWVVVDIFDDFTCHSCEQMFKTPSWEEVVYGKPT